MTSARGGGLPYKSDGGDLLGVTICGLVPLSVLKSKMSTVRVIPVPFRVFCGENI